MVYHPAKHSFAKTSVGGEVTERIDPPSIETFAAKLSNIENFFFIHT